LQHFTEKKSQIYVKLVLICCICI